MGLVALDPSPLFAGNKVFVHFHSGVKPLDLQRLESSVQRCQELCWKLARNSRFQALPNSPRPDPTIPVVCPLPPLSSSIYLATYKLAWASAPFRAPECVSYWWLRLGKGPV